jgi:hypothetical protein
VTARRLTLLLAVALACGGCAVSSPWIAPEFATPTTGEAFLGFDATLLLVGDAGEPRLDGSDPILAAVRAEAATQPDRTTVVFLGDNVYPHGLPAPGAPEREHAEQVLRVQAEAATAAGARAVFVPGNHDYAGDGWAGMQRARVFLEALDARVQALPAGGCPGPQVVDLGARLRLVALDSQWWLQDGAKPRDPSSPCPHDSEAGVRTALERAAAEAGDRRLVVVAHHPLATHGPHGGFFTWDRHLFPLRELHPWLWVPLPVVGSLYPLARCWGITDQDLGAGRYENYNRAVRSAFATHRVDVFAAGHEHTLQVLAVPGTDVHIVSGAGSTRKIEPVGRGKDTLAVVPGAGFVRLDVLPDGRARLTVHALAGDRVSQVFSSWLAPLKAR